MADNELFGISEQLDDTISRAAVVDEIEGVDWYHINKNGEMVHGANSAEHQAWYKADDIYAAIERVPSAQPVAKDINVPVKDCISRQAAIETVRKAKSIGQAHRMLVQLPSVTPKQKTGKWIYGENLGNGHDGYFCSECGWFAAVDYDFPINSEENKPTNYCPNCGAKMDWKDGDRNGETE